ncbi:hypothetical protein SLEP1_g43785 [Rubroshorea leprosula]|uniref:Uncharacterized protein n=1 Tax=Rubroshorea leprosula TaxID=152421 RepID=A0AAV5LF48_9ROSI|nr:hypothetical protein SLEP1_g43785 [Rubroshorea leprosula]
MLEPACASSSDYPSGLFLQFWRPLTLPVDLGRGSLIFPDLPTAGLDPCRSVLEISRHPLPSKLKGVP